MSIHNRNKALLGGFETNKSSEEKSLLVGKKMLLQGIYGKNPSKTKLC